MEKTGALSRHLEQRWSSVSPSWNRPQQRARRPAAGRELGQAGAADDPLAGLVEGFRAEAAKGGIDEELDEFGQGRRPGPERAGHWAFSSSSAFSWQSMQ